MKLAEFLRQRQERAVQEGHPDVADEIVSAFPHLFPETMTLEEWILLQHRTALRMGKHDMAQELRQTWPNFFAEKH
jgi:hypothetical protein